MKIQKGLLSQHTLSCNRPNKRPITNNSSKNWRKDALDNKNFADQSLIPGTKDKNYVTQVLYQDAADKPISKPSIYCTNLKKHSLAERKIILARSSCL